MIYFKHKLKDMVSTLCSGLLPGFIEIYASERQQMVGCQVFDLTLSAIPENRGGHGDYAIGFSRDWCQRNGFEPVIYFQNDGTVEKFFGSLRQTNLKMDSELYYHSKKLYGLTMPVSSKCWSDGQFIDVDCSAENEWRYIPEIFMPESRSASIYYYDDAQNEKLDDSLLEKHKLDFNPDDIEYILVKKESEIPVLLEGLSNDSRVDIAEAIDQGRIRVLTSEALANNSQPIMPASTGLKPDYRLENFVSGVSNQLAFAAARKIIDNPGCVYNPLFLYGGSGLGKSHLLHAIGNQIIVNNPDARVVCVHSEQFVGEMVGAFQRNAIESFREKYRALDVLLLDDVQLLASRQRSQEELLSIIDALVQRQSLVVFTGSRYPVFLDNIGYELQSRFGWGLTAEIESPTFEMREEIIRLKAGQAGVTLPEEVIHYIAERMESNIREIEGAVNRVIAGAEFTGQEITPDFASDALRDHLLIHDRMAACKVVESSTEEAVRSQIRLVGIEAIQRAVAEFFSIRVSDLLSGKRSRDYSRPRQIAMALADELAGLSLPEIGEAFGGRDHTSVTHACHKVAELRESDDSFNEDYMSLVRILHSGVGSSIKNRTSNVTSMNNRISEDFIDELLDSVDIVEVVGSRIRLKEEGGIYKGLCPFHNEAPPSFLVTPSRQTYHCCDCGAHGSVIRFVMDYENVDYVEAVELLAAMIGIDIRFDLS